MKLRTLSTLQIALGVSFAVHAALLGVRLVDPQALTRIFQDTPLEVILVNARTDQAPTKASAIAQANLSGGGELEQGRATSPLPPALVSLDGQASESDQQRQLREQQQRQTSMLAQVKEILAVMPPPDPQPANPTPAQLEREQQRRELIRLLAQIERRIMDENARPKKRFISPATKEAAYALYYDRLRRAIEDKGTQNFPQQGGTKLYGALTMIVNIDANGRVLSTEIVQGSGNVALDRRAQAIASSAGPFGKFSATMRRQSDIIAVVSRFNFTRDDTLQTRLSNP